MNKQQDFYDILRSKFVEREIPAEEQDWRNMRQMIDDSRKRKLRLIWGGLAVALLLLCLGGYLYLNTEIASKKDNVLAVSNQNKSIVQNNATPVLSSNKDNQPNVAVNQRPESTTANKQVVSNTPVNTPSEHVSYASANKVKANTIAPTANVAPKQHTHTLVNASIAIATDNVAKPAKTVAANNTSSGSETSESVSSVSTPKVTSVKGQENMVAQPGVEKQTTSNSVTVNENSGSAKTNSVENNVVQAEQKQNEENLSAQTQAQPQPQIQAQSQSQPEISQTGPANGSAVAKVDSSQKKTDNPQAVAPEAISQTQSLPPLPETPVNSQGLSIEAGAAYGFGWKDAGVSQGQGINPYVGIGYQKMFGFKWSVKTGIGANAISDLGTIPFILKHNTYDFGLNSNDTTLTTKWLIYATLPLQVEYKINDKNAVGLGGTVSYLLNGWGSVTVSSTSGDNNTTTSKTYNQFMYVEGYNRWNTSAFLLYRRTLFGRLSLYVMPYFGLTDIKSNSFFGQNVFERDSGIKLLLSYHIF